MKYTPLPAASKIILLSSDKTLYFPPETLSLATFGDPITQLCILNSASQKIELYFILKLFLNSFGEVAWQERRAQLTQHREPVLWWKVSYNTKAHPALVHKTTILQTITNKTPRYFVVSDIIPKDKCIQRKADDVQE
jgi:hypothetical protein